MNTRKKRDNSTSLYEVYTLSDPRDKRIYYVGISKNAQRRYKQHCKCEDQNLAKNQWVQTLLSLDLRPLLTIIEHVQGWREAQERERHWIDFHLGKGEPLSNRPNVIQEYWANMDYDTRDMITDPARYVDVRRLNRKGGQP